MRWHVHCGDILDVPADVLVCSANVYLTLSGGVGGAFLLRYGPAMQASLQLYLDGRGVRHVQRGDVIAMPACGGPYRAVLHAVAVDGAYESSPAVVGAVVAESLRQAAAVGARSVALAAVATGYGRLPLTAFAQGLAPVTGRGFPPLERVVVGVRSPDHAAELMTLLPVLEPT